MRTTGPCGCRSCSDNTPPCAYHDRIRNGKAEAESLGLVHVARIVAVASCGSGSIVRRMRLTSTSMLHFGPAEPADE
jgi:hypothetical protein